MFDATLIKTLFNESNVMEAHFIGKHIENKFFLADVITQGNVTLCLVKMMIYV